MVGKSLAGSQCIKVIPKTAICEMLAVMSSVHTGNHLVKGQRTNEAGISGLTFINQCITVSFYINDHINDLCYC